MSKFQQVVQTFQTQFKRPPNYVVRAPGRVNLIGEHTDYNDGFVLPMAIDQAVWVAIWPRKDSLVWVHSLDFDQQKSFDLSGFSRGKDEWLEYIKGMAWALQQAGYSLNGWEGVLVGDIPVGAGLSSSAALEMASAKAFATVSGLTWQPKEMALLGQQAENKWVGVNCGIMDQMISASGRIDHALLIDCRSLETELVPLPPGTQVVIMDTATRRGLVDSAYNERRSQCEEAAAFFGVSALRDVTEDQFETLASSLPPLPRRRARHVITENARTLAAVEAMRLGQAAELGHLMNASHTSLRDDFEVSSDELNLISELAQAQPGCYGARMTGAGFGGCAVALVRSEVAEKFAEEVARTYHLETNLRPSLYICRAANGAELIETE